MSTKMKVLCILVVIAVVVVGLALITTSAVHAQNFVELFGGNNVDGLLAGHCVVGTTGCTGT